MVVLPEVGGFALRHRADVLPFFLEFFELVVQGFEVGFRFDEVFEAFDDAVLALEVFLFLSFQGFDELCIQVFRIFAVDSEMIRLGFSGF